MPTPTNPYVSSAKATEAVPAILHPLVLLSISDHVTRHALRKNNGPVVGAILGQHNGHQISLEHTFDFALQKSADGSVRLDSVWFNDRLEQMRTVHKDRNLDLVGWYTMFSRAGPTASIMQVHEQILKVGSTDSATTESAVLLAFHSDDLLQQSVGGKLPITLYETSVKQDDEVAAKAPVASEVSQDQVMEDAAAETSPAVRFPFKLSEVTYTVDSGEAEMISVDFVARGAANASTKTGAPASGPGSGSAARGSSSAGATVPAGADAGAGGSVSPNSSRDRAVAIESANRSKKRLVSAGPDDSTAPAEKATGLGPAASTTAASGTLSAAEEELIATLTTRANAIRMLRARLQLLTKYVESLPADALSEESNAAESVPSEPSAIEPSSTSTTVSLPILRSIQALVQRLPLVVPPAPEGVFEEERQRETNDVELLSMLLDDMMGGISSIQGLHKKFTAMESYRWYTARQAQHGINQQAISAREIADARSRTAAGGGYATQGVY
ncbi:cop9 signalosome subunit 6 [Ophiostoma piceae UAMH 11346]|uniref:COP9 signalosome complex subunit 6 n=1 Tax=Ophiostoma piceae (strain UAMH 11346) TaxID=1262450 RepID=S3CNU5_OPHP1|nr:cop9 signalosome subunit 6 [Ophiostoma piceae UAMH 11346]